jgi:hypothetical protein
VIKPLGAGLGFVWRRDLTDGNLTSVMKFTHSLKNDKVTLILGTAQEVLGTTHAITINAKAADLAESGLYSHITLARNWRTATGRAGGDATSSLIPDIIAVRWDGTVVPFEVASAGDTPAGLAQRLREGMTTIPVANRTDITEAGNVIPLLES